MISKKKMAVIAGVALGTIAISALALVSFERSVSAISGAIPKDGVCYSAAYSSSPLEEAGLSGMYGVKIVRCPNSSLSEVTMGAYSMGIYRTSTDAYGFTEASTTEVVRLVGENSCDDEVTALEQDVLDVASLKNAVFFPIYKGVVDGAKVYRVPLKNGEAFYHIGPDGLCRKFEASIGYRGNDGHRYSDTYRVLVADFGELAPVSEEIFSSAPDEEWSDFSKKTRLFSLSALMMNASDMQIGDPNKTGG